MQNKIKTFGIPVAAILLLILMILWQAGAFKDKIEPGIIARQNSYRGETLTVAARDIMQYEEASATVRSRHSVDIAARILAPIKAIHVKSGDLVDKDDLLIELDDRNMRANAAQARARINAVKARLVEAKSNFIRTRNLYARESATKADLEKAAANYESLKAQLASARQSLQASETVLSYSRIKAPFAARVTDKYAEPGDLASPGMKLLTLYNPQALRIDANVRESLALALKTGQTLQTHIAALNATIPASIEEIVPSADPGARSFLVKATIASYPRLVPGMFAKLRIPSGKQAQLLVPPAYIKQVGQLDMVWVLENSVPVRRFIRVGQHYDKQMKVISGLSTGEKLIAPKDMAETARKRF